MPGFMTQILAVKIELPIEDAANISPETLQRFMDKMTLLGCESASIESFSWGMFPVRACNPDQLLPELAVLTSQIEAAAIELDIFHAVTR